MATTAHLERNKKYKHSDTYKNGKAYQNDLKRRRVSPWRAYTLIQNRARKNNLELCQREEFVGWYQAQIKMCVHCHTLDPKPKDRFEIDRIDSEKGYTLKNIQLSCYKCNCRKRTQKEQIFREKKNKQEVEDTLKLNELLASHDIDYGPRVSIVQAITDKFAVLLNDQKVKTRKMCAAFHCERKRHEKTTKLLEQNKKLIKKLKEKLTEVRSVGPMAKTPACHAGNKGSIPLQTESKKDLSVNRRK